MRDYSLSHVRDAVLVENLTILVRQERVTIADVLAHIAEVDARKLYAPAGYSSMFVYCVHELHFSEDETSNRIQAARAARQHPALFTALAQGRLHLTAVRLLAPHLTAENVDELIEEASHKRKPEIEDMLSARFRVIPSPSAAALAQAGLPLVSPFVPEHAPGRADEVPVSREHVPEHVDGLPLGNEHVLEHVASGRFDASPAPVCEITVRQSTREKLRYAQALLSHAIPTGDLSDVLDRAIDLLVAQTQRRRFGAGRSHQLPPRPFRANASSRYIPAAVRHAVWERDGGRCTFIGTNGRRCNAERFLEFDHVEPYARHPAATVEGIRLRCRTHNQLEGERVFGSDFMSRKRDEARTRAAAARAEVDAVTKEQIRDVIAGLRNLQIRLPDAKRAAESTLTMISPTLEDRMRAALSYLTPRRQPMTPRISSPQRHECAPAQRAPVVRAHE